MFDVNAAPFYQSFVEVRVEPSKARIRFLPHGVHGRLTWADLEASPGAKPPDASPDTPVDWSVPMTGGR
jgi:hypothetical protein